MKHLNLTGAEQDLLDYLERIALALEGLNNRIHDLEYQVREIDKSLVAINQSIVDYL